MKESNRVMSMKAAKHKDKKDHIKRFMDKSMNYTSSKWEEVHRIEETVIDLKREHLHNLQEFIFPIIKIQPRTSVISLVNADACFHGLPSIVR
jgi:hypothetical protein